MGATGLSTMAPHSSVSVCTRRAPQKWYGAWQVAKACPSFPPRERGAFFVPGVGQRRDQRERHRARCAPTPARFSGQVATNVPAVRRALSRPRSAERSEGGLDRRSPRGRYTFTPPGRAGLLGPARAQRPIERVAEPMGGEEAMPGSSARGGGNPAPHRAPDRVQMPAPALR